MDHGLSKYCIIMPVHNEARTIKGLLEQIKKEVGCDVAVIDDGSLDGSGEKARQFGAHVITNKMKSGKGFSLREGFKYALANGYQGVITMDGDGQHLPQDLKCFFNYPKINNSCIIVGNRMHDTAKMPLVRRWTNRFMSSIISLAARQTITDTQCGLRFIGSEVLNRVQLKCSGFEIESEILMKASKKGFLIYTVDIHTVYQDEVSKINPLRDTLRFFTYFFKELFS